MRTSAIIALAALVSVSSAAGGVPTCAQPCVGEFTTGSSIAGCNSLNTNCICSNKDFLNNIACCLLDKCDETGRNDAIAYAKTICATADPPVEVPDQVVCSTTSSSGAAAATTGSSTTGGTTQAPTTGTTSTPTSAAQTSSSSGAAMVNMGSSGMGLAGGFAAALVLL